MELQAVTKGAQIIVEGVPGVRLLHSPGDVARVIEACFVHGSRLVLLYAENLPEGFFDLSSGQAGEILQKFRNYHMKLAIVLSPDAVKLSSNFGLMLGEEQRGGEFHVFEDSASAEEWLARR